MYLLLLFVASISFCLISFDNKAKETAFLQSNTPKTGLLQVERNDEGNYSVFLQLGEKPTFSMRTLVVKSDCDILPADLCPIADEEVTFSTNWTKIKFDPNNMTIDSKDFTFATTDVYVRSSSN
jgi:hypothetical protein